MNTLRTCLFLIALPLAACAASAAPPPASPASPPAQASPAPASPPAEATTGQLSYGMVKSQLQDGVTTQAEIVALFGAPNIVTKNSKKNEVWVYSKQSSSSTTTTRSDAEVQQRARLASFLGFATGGAEAQGSQTAQTQTTSSVSSIDLILTFDDGDVMIEYSVVASQF